MSYTVERDWEHSEFRCIVIATDMGHRCGYVGVPKGYLLFSKTYSDFITDEMKDAWKKVREEPVGKRGIIDLVCHDPNKPRIGFLFAVHGGITFSDADGKYPIESELWWFGFDCGHIGDAKDESIMSEECKEIEQRYPSSFQEGVVRTLDYCVGECESLAKQIREVGGGE